MKILFNIKNETIEKEYEISYSLIQIKRELINEYFKNVCKYLDFELLLERPIKHFGKLGLEPGIIPTTMDKFKLDKFSISGINLLKINVIENNNCNILEILDNTPSNQNSNKNNIKFYEQRFYNENNENNKQKNIQEKKTFIYNEEDFPELGS
jgi:hypothetical protein